MVPTLSDGVVVLDQHTDADLEAHLVGEDDEQARRFGWYPARSTDESVRRAFSTWRQEWETKGPTRTFALREAGSRELVGGIQVRRRREGVAELAYWVFPLFRGRGFATQGLRLASEWALADFGVERLELHVEPDNVPSRKAARAAGFVEQGLVKEHDIGEGRLRDVILYTREVTPT